MKALAAPLRILGTPWRYASRIASFAAFVLARSLAPGTWRRTVRNVLARQILFTGIEAVLFVSFVALLVGISVVAQAQIWLARFGQKAFLGDLLVLVIVREAAPILTNFVVIGRSGTAVAAELGNMTLAGEVELLEAQGIDPFSYLVLPRVLGIMLSVFCLTCFFVLVSFAGGYVTALLLGADPVHPALFVRNVLASMDASAVFSVIAKTLVPGLATGAICCYEGLRVKAAVTEVPQASTRALVRSVAALFITSATVSVLTYGG